VAVAPHPDSVIAGAERDLVTTIDAHLLNPILSVVPALPIGLRLEHLCEGLAGFFQLPLGKVQNRSAELRLLVDVGALGRITQYPIERRPGLVPTARELRIAAEVQFSFPSPWTVGKCLPVLSEERGRFGILVLIPLLNRTTERFVVFLLLLSLRSIFDLGRLCRSGSSQRTTELAGSS